MVFEIRSSTDSPVPFLQVGGPRDIVGMGQDHRCQPHPPRRRHRPASKAHAGGAFWERREKNVSTEFEPVIASREPLATDIVRQLLDHLLEGRLGAGDKLPSERSLAGTMRVGRSVVREALRTLTLLGLIEVRQGDGNYIKSTESDVLPTVIEWGLLLGARQTEDLVEARCHLEVLVAGLAAERRNEDNLHDLQRAISRMWAAGSDPEKYAEADIAFHQRISLAARNETLHRVMLSIQSLLRVWIPRVIATRGGLRADHTTACTRHGGHRGRRPRAFPSGHV